MPKRINPLLKEFDISVAELELRADEFMKGAGLELLDEAQEEILSLADNEIIKGTIIGVTSDEVTIDIGYKAEGVIQLDDFEDEEPPKIGDVIQVLIEATDDESGMLYLSKRKADRLINWNQVISKHKEGDSVTGKVTRKIKGGLLVDIGVPVFLPASQVSIRRAKDISEYIGQELECEIIKIDEDRMNIVVSRRKLIEKIRDRMKQSLLAEIKEGEVREGVVKNIADFGAFVDLGGIDGLLHITDMSWGRIQHPSEMVKVDDKVEVMVLRVDRERERIALGLKQKSASPWENVMDKYPAGTRVNGEVVNIMSYGAFVKLEDGIEGLVHISEMSWTKRVNHPSEVVKIGDEADVVVLGVNKDKQEISLGMKQVMENPWDSVAEKYPVGSHVKGRVRNLTNYGAFIELEEGIDGLLHISDMSWTKKVSHPNEVVKKGDEIETIVLSVDTEKKRIALGLKQMAEDPWENEIPGRYLVGSHFRGKVTKITNFGVFVELEEDLEGLLHISELSPDRKVNNAEEVVKVGQKLDVRVIRVDPKERKVGLSLSVQLEEQNLDGDEPSPGVANLIAKEPAPEARAEAVAAAAAASAGHGTLGAALAQAMDKKRAEREAKEEAEEAEGETDEEDGEEE